jgi:MarR family transcriptional regulator, 2-MHQ and catechol-resistance regulon repressor
MPTHHTGTESEKRALNAFITLMRAADSLTSRLSQGLAEHGLTASQFGILETLLHLGPLCQKELAQKLLVSDANVTVVLGNLERRGLVVRERSSVDRRLVTVALTAAGQKLIAAAFPRHMAAIVAELEILSPAEQETLRRLCRSLGTQNKTSSARRSHG